MSATLDAGAGRGVPGRLPGRRACPAARTRSTMRYAPDARRSPAPCARRSRGRRGHVLCFLPGAPRDPARAADARGRRRRSALDVLPLHGSLAADEQDAAIAPVGAAQA